MLLGSLLWRPEALLEGSAPQKHCKTYCFVRCLQVQMFGSLMLWMALLGPFLGRSCPKMAATLAPIVAQKAIIKVNY